MGEPPIESPALDPTELDLLLVPAVALDLGRRRCGHGMGFYDRYIARARVRQSDRVAFRTIGLGLSEQREEEVPMEEHDELLDAVLFPDAEAVVPEAASEEQHVGDVHA